MLIKFWIIILLCISLAYSSSFTTHSLFSSKKQYAAGQKNIYNSQQYEGSENIPPENLPHLGTIKSKPSINIDVEKFHEEPSLKKSTLSLDLDDLKFDNDQTWSSDTQTPTIEITPTTSQKKICFFQQDPAAQASERYEQNDAFKKLPEDLAQTLLQRDIPDLKINTLLRDIAPLEIFEILKNLGLIQDKDTPHISIEKISDKSQYTETAFKVFISYPWHTSSQEQHSHSNISLGDSKKLLYILKFHHPRKASKETLHSEIGVTLHHSLRQQNTVDYPHLPRLSFTEKIAKITFKDGPRYVSVIHAAHGISLKNHLRSIQNNEEDLKKVATHLGTALGTFHTYHALRFDAKKLLDTVHLQVGQKNDYILDFPTITHGDLHADNIFIDLTYVTPLFRFIDLESMFLGAVNLNDNRNDISKIFISFDIILGQQKSDVLFQTFKEAYNSAVLNTIQKYQERHFQKIANRWKYRTHK